MVFLFSYILGPLLGGFFSSMLLRLTRNIYDDGETEKDVTVQEEAYEIGKASSAINDGDDDDMGFDSSGERRKSRGDNRGMTVLLSQGSAGSKASYLRK